MEIKKYWKQGLCTNCWKLIRAPSICIFPMKIWIIKRQIKSTWDDIYVLIDTDELSKIVDIYELERFNRFSITKNESCGHIIYYLLKIFTNFDGNK